MQNLQTELNVCLVLNPKNTTIISNQSLNTNVSNNNISKNNTNITSLQNPVIIPNQFININASSNNNSISKNNTYITSKQNLTLISNQSTSINASNISSSVSNNNTNLDSNLNVTKINNQSTITNNSKTNDNIFSNIKNNTNISFVSNVSTGSNLLKPNVNSSIYSNSTVDKGINSSKKSLLASNELNWIYGFSTFQEFTQQGAKLEKEGASFCPQEKPFASTENECIFCENIFDYSQKKCVFCPQGTKINPSIHQCVYPDGTTFLKNSYFLSKIPMQGQKPKTYPNLSTCDAFTPYFNSTSCIACLQNQVFNVAVLRCVPSPCSNDQVFDSDTQRCKYSVIYRDNPTALNFLGTPPTYSQNSVACPQESPFAVRNSCSSCALPSYFDYKNMSCLVCASPQTIFDIATKSCVPDSTKFTFISNIRASNYIGTSLLFNNNSKFTSECPLQTPFYNGKYCIQCPQLFNFQSLSCQSCAGKTVFLNNKCVLPAPPADSIMNSYTINVTNFIGRVPEINSLQSTCSSFSPFFNGSQCLSCNLPSYFNFQTNVCSQCPKNTGFSLQSRKCVFIVESRVTNLASVNLFYNGNFTDVIRKVKTQQQKGVISCFEDTPFYDATTDNCIGCPSTLPYFNFRYNECMNCGEGTVFDPTNHVCLASTSIDPTIQRMLMNVFNFDFFS